MRRNTLLALIGLAVFSVAVAISAAPSPNNCGLNMLCRVRTLIVSGSATFGGDVTQVGDAGVSGNLHVYGTLGVAGELTVSSAVSAPVLDGGAGIFSTVNTSGAMVVGNGLTSTAGTSTFGTGVFQTGAQLQGAGTALNLSATNFCDQRGASGTLTCNGVGGHATLPSGGAGVQINSTIAKASSIVLAQIQTVDATCLGVQAQPDGGNIVFLPTANCTGATDFSWFQIVGP